MKVISKVVIDIETMQVVEQAWFNYEGPVVQLKGGGTSGTVDFPAHMKVIHQNWLDNTGVDVLSTSMTDAMENAIGSSPYTALMAYDPDAELSENSAAITAYAAVLAGIDPVTNWAALYAQAVASVGAVNGLSEAEIIANADAFANQLDDEINTKILPQFRRGMQDINAVVSSAFPIGEAIILAFRDRDVAKYLSGLRIAAIEMRNKGYLEAAQQMLHLQMQRVAWHEGYAKIVIENNRIKIVAKKEETDVNSEIDVHDALWDLEVFQHGANLLGSIGGGTSSPKGVGRAASAIGGGLSGAAGGAMLGAQIGAAGGPIGAAGGAVIGAIAGIASAFL